MASYLPYYTRYAIDFLQQLPTPLTSKHYHYSLYSHPRPSTKDGRAKRSHDQQVPSRYPHGKSARSLLRLLQLIFVAGARISHRHLNHNPSAANNHPLSSALPNPPASPHSRHLHEHRCSRSDNTRRAPTSVPVRHHNPFRKATTQHLPRARAINFPCPPTTRLHATRCPSPPTIRPSIPRHGIRPVRLHAGRRG